jgi:hypothetical protein
MEQIESDFMLQKGAKFILSPQEAVDCNGDKSFRNGCKGGWPDGAYQSGMQLGGFELEADYPDQGKIDQKCLYEQSKAVVTIEGFQSVGKGSETQMKQHVGSTGPLSVCLLAAWKGYKGGILSGCPNNKGSDHCVQIVGYGTDGGKAYWKVRNSWGPTWGEQGHIRLAFGSNQCNINSHPTSTTAGKILHPSPPTPPTPPSPTPPSPSPSGCGSCKVCLKNGKCQTGARAPKTKADCEAKGSTWCGPVASDATDFPSLEYV